MRKQREKVREGGGKRRTRTRQGESGRERERMFKACP